MFSIIVPTYNEENDLSRTLEALGALDYPDYEVLIVDDGSKDKTVEIAERFAGESSRFRVLRQPQNRGVASARNRGIDEARGKILILLNADAILPADYLIKLRPYYQNGNEWVGVYSRVMNLDTIYSRFTAAEEYSYYFIEKKHWVWSEGFSCTKKAALAVGLFPEAMPGCSGEDVDFGLLLEKKFPGIKVPEIEAPHIAPDDLIGYWNQQKGRGKGRSNLYYYMRRLGVGPLFVSSLLATAWRLIKILFGYPIWRAWNLSRKRKNDFLPFIWVGIVREAAMISGIWSGYLAIERGVRGNR